MRNSDIPLSNIPAVFCFFATRSSRPPDQNRRNFRLSQPLHEESVKTFFTDPSATHFILRETVTTANRSTAPCKPPEDGK